MDLESAIQFATRIDRVKVTVVITMHDENGQVLVGSSAPIFFRTASGGLLRTVSEGFSTVGNPMPVPGFDRFLSSNNFAALTQPFDVNQPIPLEFTVTRRRFFVKFPLLPSIQLNLATLDAGGQVLNRAVLAVKQDGVLLRGQGPAS